MGQASKYFNSALISPPITASLQHAGAFTAGDLLFDWIGVAMPPGAARLIGATALVRPKGDTGPTPNNQQIDLVFAHGRGQVGSAHTTAPVSLGTINSVAMPTPHDDLIGFMSIPRTDHNSVASGMAGGVMTTSVKNGPVIEPLQMRHGREASQSGKLGMFYMAGIAAGALNFTTINRINNGGGYSAGSATAITMDDGSGGTSMDCTEHFIAGDILHAHDDANLGTVASVTAQQITLNKVNFAALADNDYV